jgi:hypothetical protein
MTTERLAVLAGAAALGEFTAAELAAYTGANSNTVRQVLQREQKLHGFFERVRSSKHSTGRPAVLWQVTDDHRAQILEEIADEEAKLAQLKGSVDSYRPLVPPVDPAQRASMLVTSAEETIARSYDADDARERLALAATALNLLRAARPVTFDPNLTSGDAPDTDWWDGKLIPPQEEYTASLETILPLSIESQLRTVQQPRQVLEQIEVLQRRAHRVAAFAKISARQAEGLAIEPDELREAAESISAGSSILPVAQTLGWMKVFVDISIAARNSAPVAVLARSDQSPKKLLPVSHDAWRQVRPPAELAHRGYSLWVESWAEALLASRLMPGLVVAHDGSEESDDALTDLLSEMADRHASQLGRAVVVASTAKDFQAVARVSLGGGIFYPLSDAMNSQAVNELQVIVNREVTRAVSANPNLGSSYWMISAVNRDDPNLELVTSGLDVLRVVTSTSVAPSDLELAQRTLALVDDAVRELSGEATDAETADQPVRRDEALAWSHFVRRLAGELSDLGGSRNALSVAEEVLGSWRRIIQYKASSYLGNSYIVEKYGPSAEKARRSEIEDDMRWVYESISKPSES